MLSALPTPNLLAVWARRAAGVQTRIVVSERDARSTESGGARKWRQRYLAPLLKRAYLMADGIIAVSNGVADDLAARPGLPPARITTVYNPVVDPDLYRRAREPVDHPWFAPGEPPVDYFRRRAAGQEGLCDPDPGVRPDCADGAAGPSGHPRDRGGRRFGVRRRPQGAARQAWGRRGRGLARFRSKSARLHEPGTDLRAVIRPRRSWASC